MDLKGKIAIVTGAGKGIGRKTVLSLAREGCRVVLVSRTEDELEKVKKEIASIKEQLNVEKKPKLNPKYAKERAPLLAFTEAMGYKNAPFHVEWYRFLQFRFSPFKDEIREKMLEEAKKYV